MGLLEEIRRASKKRVAISTTCDRFAAKGMASQSWAEPVLCLTVQLPSPETPGMTNLATLSRGGPPSREISVATLSYRLF
jgi:hypothetical protein